MTRGTLRVRVPGPGLCGEGLHLLVGLRHRIQRPQSRLRFRFGRVDPRQQPVLPRRAGGLDPEGSGVRDDLMRFHAPNMAGVGGFVQREHVDMNNDCGRVSNGMTIPIPLSRADHGRVD